MTLFPDFKTFLEINIGSLHIAIAWYAVLILTGALLAYKVSIHYATKLGYDKSMLEDFFYTVLPIGVIGARLYYCIFEWENYASDPISIFYIWEGGLAIHGGLIAAVLYAFYFFHKRGVNILRLGDCIMPNIFIAQIIGRWGNFMNQEAFGEIVSADYFNYFPAFIKDHMYINGFYRQPMFLYEGIGNLIGFLLITFVYRNYKKRKRGDLIYAYVAWYGLVRFFVEMFRTDALLFLGLKMAQIVSIIFIVIGIMGILGVYDKVFKNYYPFKKQKPIVLFDVDGTLIDSKALIFDSFIHTFKHYKPGYELSAEELQSFFGPTLYETFGKYFDQEKVEEIVAYYREYNHEHHDEFVKEMPHAKEMLETLKKEGFTVGAVSNKLPHTVNRGLELTGLMENMDVVIGFDKSLKPKPAPDSILKACKDVCYPVDDVVYVGDAISDVMAAKNMGAYSIGFAQSKEDEERLSKVNPCIIISDLIELIPILKEEKSWDELVI